MFQKNLCIMFVGYVSNNGMLDFFPQTPLSFAC